MKNIIKNIAGPVFVGFSLILVLMINVAHAVSTEDILEEQKAIKNSQKTPQKSVTLSDKANAIEAGRTTYEKACAICHGMSARGDGIFSDEINRKPADLTKLAQKHGGSFPFEYAYKIIDGREAIALHGSREMPIWGDQFSFELWLDVPPDFVDTAIRGRIFELLLYLNSIQVH